jgi:hypothetical protein
MAKIRHKLSDIKGMNINTTVHQSNEAIKLINVKPTTNGLETRNSAKVVCENYAEILNYSSQNASSLLADALDEPLLLSHSVYSADTTLLLYTEVGSGALVVLYVKRLGRGSYATMASPIGGVTVGGDNKGQIQVVDGRPAVAFINASDGDKLYFAIGDVGIDGSIDFTLHDCSGMGLDAGDLTSASAHRSAKIYLDSMEYLNNSAAQNAYVNPVASTDVTSDGTWYVSAEYSTYVKENCIGDTNVTTHWRTRLDDFTHYDKWVAVKFASQERVASFTLKGCWDGNNATLRFWLNPKIQGSNTSTDGSDGVWTDLYTHSGAVGYDHDALVKRDLTTPGLYSWYRAYQPVCVEGYIFGGGSWLLYKDNFRAFSHYDSTLGRNVLKCIGAQSSSAGQKLVRTFSAPINLSEAKEVRFKIKSNRTGANVKVTVYNAGPPESISITPNIVAADTWTDCSLSLQGHSSSLVTKLEIEMVDDSAETIVYISDVSYTNSEYSIEPESWIQFLLAGTSSAGVSSLGYWNIPVVDSLDPVLSKTVVINTDGSPCAHVVTAEGHLVVINGGTGDVTFRVKNEDGWVTTSALDLPGTDSLVDYKSVAVLNDTTFVFGCVDGDESVTYSVMGVVDNLGKVVVTNAETPVYSTTSTTGAGIKHVAITDRYYCAYVNTMLDQDEVALCYLMDDGTVEKMEMPIPVEDTIESWNLGYRSGEVTLYTADGVATPDGEIRYRVIIDFNLDEYDHRPTKDLGFVTNGIRLDYDQDTQQLSRLGDYPYGETEDMFSTEYRNIYMFKKDGVWQLGSVYPNFSVLFAGPDAIRNEDQSWLYYHYNPEFNTIVWAGLGPYSAYNSSSGATPSTAAINYIDKTTIINPVSVWETSGSGMIYEKANLWKTQYGEPKQLLMSSGYVDEDDATGSFSGDSSGVYPQARPHGHLIITNPDAGTGWIKDSRTDASGIITASEKGAVSGDGLVRLEQLSNFGRSPGYPAVYATLTTAISNQYVEYGKCAFTGADASGKFPPAYTAVANPAYYEIDGVPLDISALYREKDNVFAQLSDGTMPRLSYLLLADKSIQTNEYVLRQAWVDFDDYGNYNTTQSLEILRISLADPRYGGIAGARLASMRFVFDGISPSDRTGYFLLYSTDRIWIFTFRLNYTPGERAEISEVELYKTVDRLAFPFAAGNIIDIYVHDAPTPHAINRNLKVPVRPYYGYLLDTDDPRASASGRTTSESQESASATTGTMLITGIAGSASGAFVGKQVDVVLMGTTHERVITSIAACGAGSEATAVHTAYVDQAFPSPPISCDFTFRQGVVSNDCKLFYVPMTGMVPNVYDVPIDVDNATQFSPLLSSSKRWKNWLFYALPAMPLDQSIGAYRIAKLERVNGSDEVSVLSQKAGAYDPDGSITWKDRLFPALHSSESVALYDASESKMHLANRNLFRNDVFGFKVTDYHAVNLEISDAAWQDGICFIVDNANNAMYVTNGGLFAVNMASVVAIKKPVRVVPTNYGVVVACEEDVRRYIGFDPANMVQSKVLESGIEKDDYYCVDGYRDYAVVQNADSVYMISQTEKIDIGWMIEPYLNLDTTWQERCVAVDGANGEIWVQINLGAVGNIVVGDSILCKVAYAIFSPANGSWRIYAYNKQNQSYNTILYSAVAHAMIANIGDSLCIPEVKDVEMLRNEFNGFVTWDKIAFQFTTRESSLDDVTAQKKIQYLTLDNGTIRPLSDEAKPDYLRVRIYQHYDKYNELSNVVKQIEKTTGYNYVSFGIPIDATVYTGAIDITLARTVDNKNPKIILKDLILDVTAKGRKRQGGYNL